MKLNIGSGSKKKEGYTNCDIVSLDNVDIVCPADIIPLEDNSVEEVLTEHLIEHLTFEEFQRAIIEWHRVLESGGKLIIECPDLFGICKAFVNENEYQQYNSFKGYWPLIMHLYGHQRGNSAEEKNYQIHKSGYTSDYLMTCLEGIGFNEFTSFPPEKANPCSPTIRIACIKC